MVEYRDSFALDLGDSIICPYDLLTEFSIQYSLQKSDKNIYKYKSYWQTTLTFSAGQHCIQYFQPWFLSGVPL